MLKVKVVIPLYREELPELELKLLLNNLKVLAQHHITFVLPEGLNLDAMRRDIDIDRYEIITVSPEWLGRKNGIAGYNKMMMSVDFYRLFTDSEYILICQTDAYIFRDELLKWCDKGYDYVGAPWPKRRLYENRFVQLYLKFRDLTKLSKLKILRQHLFDKVGNGGLSLRKVQCCIDMCIKYSDIIEQFCTKEHNRYNEDVFWALIPSEIKYPSISEALEFSIDIKPQYCFELAQYKKPFGVHGLTYPKYYQYWVDIIPLLNE